MSIHATGFAGLLVLLYAQPLTRILMLEVTDVSIEDDRVYLRHGREPVELPEPLAELTASLARSPTGRASTAIAGAEPPWLFQGMRVGQPLSHSRATRRLNRLGVPNPRRSHQRDHYARGNAATGHPR
jgi:hypothetical protein